MLHDAFTLMLIAFLCVTAPEKKKRKKPGMRFTVRKKHQLHSNLSAIPARIGLHLRNEMERKLYAEVARAFKLGFKNDRLNCRKKNEMKHMWNVFQSNFKANSLWQGDNDEKRIDALVRWLKRGCSENEITLYYVNLPEDIKLVTKMLDELEKDINNPKKTQMEDVTSLLLKVEKLETRVRILEETLKNHNIL